MSDRSPSAGKQKDASVGEPSRGPSLTLLYSLIAIALLVAIGIAALIVLPFHRRR